MLFDFFLQEVYILSSLFVRVHNLPIRIPLSVYVYTFIFALLLRKLPRVTETHV